MRLKKQLSVKRNTPVETQLAVLPLFILGSRKEMTPLEIRRVFASDSHANAPAGGDDELAAGGVRQSHGAPRRQGDLADYYLPD